MDAKIYPVASKGHDFSLNVYEITIWLHKNYCMHSPCNTLLNLHEPIHSFPLHLHVHLALEEEPFEVQDLGLGLSLQTNPTKKLSRFNVSMIKVLHPTIFMK
jgi:hypothetical protein